MPKILYLNLTYNWFDEIKADRKKEEYRVVNNFWKSRIEDKAFDEIYILRGYPRKGKNGYDPEVIQKFKWNGYEKRVVKYPILEKNVNCYCINLSERI